MIQDARVLREEFVPGEVQHRDGEVNHLSSVLEPTARGQHSETAIITGPSGAGKTCIARFTVGKLQQEFLDVETQYVNCWQNYSRFRVLYSILEGLGKTVDIHRQSTPKDVLIDRLREHNQPAVVILDEVDQLQDADALYDLHTLPGFSMVLVTNREEDLFTGLDERLQSRLSGAQRIRFDRYSLDALTAILAARAEQGLLDNVVTKRELKIIADTAAGDARLALSILRSAAQRATQDDAEEITESVIEASIPDARDDVRQKSLDSLTPHQRTLYDIIEAEGEIAPITLYEMYQQEVDDPKTDRTIRTYLSKMEQYDLVVATGESRDRRYRLASRSTTT
jgi:Cdc6-like AAA superfamily ATPase